MGHGSFVGVPAAKVIHPWWANPLQQVCGWAAGDTLCLVTLPHRSFFALPNWIELILVITFLGFCKAVTKEQAMLWISICAIVEIAMIVPGYYVNACTNQMSERYPTLLIAFCAVIPPMMQDVVRLWTKLSRWKFTQVFYQFDWMNGSGKHPQEMKIASFFKVICTALIILALNDDSSLLPAHSATVILFIVYGFWVTKKMELLPAAYHFVKRPPLPFEMPRKGTCFVVLAYPRTGSNLFCGYLGAHDGISMHFELFNEKAIYSKDTEVTTDIGVLRQRDSDPCNFLLSKLSEGNQGGAIGFKLFPEHVNRGQEFVASKLEDFFERALADPRIKKVLLHRENRLAVCVSNMRAQITGDYINTNHDTVQVHIKSSDFSIFSKGYGAYYDFLRNRLEGQNYIWVSYEDLVSDPESLLETLLAGLALNSERPRR